MNPELISCGVHVAEVKTVLGNKKIVKTFCLSFSVLDCQVIRGVPGVSLSVPGCSAIPGFETSHCSHCCNKRYGTDKSKSPKQMLRPFYMEVGDPR